MYITVERLKSLRELMRKIFENEWESQHLEDSFILKDEIKEAMLQRARNHPLFEGVEDINQIDWYMTHIYQHTVLVLHRPNSRALYFLPTTYGAYGEQTTDIEEITYVLNPVGVHRIDLPKRLQSETLDLVVTRQCCPKLYRPPLDWSQD